jgi:hypothetical protein
MVHNSRLNATVQPESGRSLHSALALISIPQTAKPPLYILRMLPGTRGARVSELYHIVVRSFCPSSPLTFGIYSSWSCDNFQNGWPGAKYLYHLMERKACCQHCIFVAFSLFQFGFDFVAVYGFQEIVAFWLSLATSM